MRWPVLESRLVFDCVEYEPASCARDAEPDLTGDGARQEAPVVALLKLWRRSDALAPLDGVNSGRYWSFISMALLPP